MKASLTGVLLFALASPPLVSGAEPPLTAVTARRLLDVKTGKYVERPVVIVRGDRIERVGTEVPAGARVVDLGDRVLLPGLIDAHTHVLLQGDATQPEYDEQILKEYPAHRVARAVRALKIALEHGFTTIRDVETEGAGYDDVALRDAVNEGVIPGPRMKVVGPALSTTGSYPIQHFRPDWKFPSGVMVCDGADGCRRAVREQLAYGVDWIKIYANTGGLRLTADGYVDSPPNWTKEEIDAVVSEAHAHGVKVAAHARSDTGVRIAIAAGVDSIEHGDSIRPEAAAEMARKGIFLSPTLTVADYVAGPRAQAGCVYLRRNAEVPCALGRQLPQGGRPDRLRHGRRRLPVDRDQPGQGVRVRGPARHVAHRGHPNRDDGRGGVARHAGPGGLGRARRFRGPGGRAGRPPSGCRGSDPDRFRHERRGGRASDRCGRTLTAERAC